MVALQPTIGIVEQLFQGVPTILPQSFAQPQLQPNCGPKLPSVARRALARAMKASTSEAVSRRTDVWSFFCIGGGPRGAGVLHGQLDALLGQLLKLLAAFHRLAQLLGARAGQPLGVVLAFLPNLILVVGAQRMAGVGPRSKLGFEGAVFHLVDPGHFLEDHLTLLDKFAHTGSPCRWQTGQACRITFCFHDHFLSALRSESGGQLSFYIGEACCKWTKLWFDTFKCVRSSYTKPMRVVVNSNS